MRIIRFIGLIVLLFFAGISVTCGGGGGGGQSGHTISGTVTFEGAGLPGVTMTLNCSGGWLNPNSYTKTAATDSSGNYWFTAGTDYCSIRASKYGFKIVAWSSGLNPVLGDMPGVNFLAKSCREECPVLVLWGPDNNVVISKSAYKYGIWDDSLQAVYFGGSAEIDNCGGASLVEWNYTIDGKVVDQAYKGEGGVEVLVLGWRPPPKLSVDRTASGSGQSYPL